MCTKLAFYFLSFFIFLEDGLSVPRPDILNLVSSIKQEGNLQINPEWKISYGFDLGLGLNNTYSES
jgi:hypothetical protein